MSIDQIRVVLQDALKDIDREWDSVVSNCITIAENASVGVGAMSFGGNVVGVGSVSHGGNAQGVGAMSFGGTASGIGSIRVESSVAGVPTKAALLNTFSTVVCNAYTRSNKHWLTL
jgi:hypothetical protein